MLRRDPDEEGQMSSEQPLAIVTGGPRGIGAITTGRAGNVTASQAAVVAVAERRSIQRCRARTSSSR